MLLLLLLHLDISIRRVFFLSGGCGATGASACAGSSGSNTDYAGTIGQSNVAVIVQSYYANDDWFLGQKGRYYFDFYYDYYPALLLYNY